MAKEHTGNEAYMHAASAHQRVDRVESEISTVWEHINAVEKRLPMWATVCISVLTFLLGSAITLIGILVRLWLM